MVCNAPHPVRAGVRCEAPDSNPNHPFHMATVWDGLVREDLVWDNPDVQVRLERAQPKDPGGLRDLAEQIPREPRNGRPPPPSWRTPIVRGDDPWGAHVGAERVEPGLDQLEAIALSMFRERPRRNRAEFMDPLGPLGRLDGDRRARALRKLEYGAFYIKLVPTQSGPLPSDYVLTACPRCGYELFYLEEQQRPGERPLEWSRCIPCEVTYTSRAGTLDLSPI